MKRNFISSLVDSYKKPNQTNKTDKNEKKPTKAIF